MRMTDVTNEALAQIRAVKANQGGRLEVASERGALVHYIEYSMHIPP